MPASFVKGDKSSLTAIGVRRGTLFHLDGDIRVLVKKIDNVNDTLWKAYCASVGHR